MAKSKHASRVDVVSPFFFLCLATLLGACGGINNSGATPGGGSGGTPVYNPPAGKVDDSAGFYMRYVRNPNYTYVDHAGSLTPTAPCVGTQGQITYCYIEAPELDLYVNGVSIQYNVPTTLCNYVVFTPYYFFYLEPGNGPASVQQDTDKNGVVGIDCNNNGVINPGAGGGDACDVIGVQTNCQYDYQNANGPNCCYGQYTLTTRVWNTTTNNYDVSVSLESWGGLAANCAAGPAMDTQQKFAGSGPLQGYPMSVIADVTGVGVNAVYTVKAPNDLQHNTDLYAANYYNNAETGGAVPTPMATATGYTTEPFFRVQCYDRAQEYNSEIRLMVRKWNTMADFNNLAADPTKFGTTGMEGAPWANFSLDDRFAWPDYQALVNEYPGFSW